MLDVKVPPNIDLRAEFSPDANTVLLSDDKLRVHIFEVESGKLRTPPIPSGVNAADFADAVRAVKFTADGSACFILDLDGTLERYDARTWKAQGKTMRHPNGPAYDIGFDVSADGKWAVTFDSPGENGPMGTAQMWNAETGERLGSLIKKQNGVTAKFLSKHPGRLLLRGERGGAGILELPSGTEQFAIREHDDVDSPIVMITPDGDYTLSYGPDNCLALQSARTGKLLALLTTEARMTDVLLAPDSRSAFAVFNNSAFSTQGHYDLYVMKLGFPKGSDDSQRMEFTGSIRVLDFIHRTVLSRDGRMLMIQCGITDNERVRIFDTATLKPLAGYRE